MRHGETIAAWRERHLHRSELSTSRLPLRYRLADRAVGTVKARLGRHYAAVRSGAIKTGELARRVKSATSLDATLRMVVKPLPFVGPAGSWTVRALRSLARGAQRFKGHGPACKRSIWVATAGPGLPGRP